MIHINEETSRCLLCANAPCGAKAARAVRALRFDNPWTAAELFDQMTEEELLQAEKACIHYDRPIRLATLKKETQKLPTSNFQLSTTLNSKLSTLNPKLSITFCGIPCENPFFLASSAVCTNYEMVARALEAGWAGVFYKTICKQDIREVSPRFDAVGDGGTSFIGFRNMEQLSENPYEMDFDILHRLKQNYPSKVIVASIMGQTEEEWVELAKMAEDAGCDAVELNFSCPQMKMTGMGSDVGQNAELVLFYTSFVKDEVKIPVIPKMTPNITSMTHVAMAAFFAEADGISAINTIKSVTMSPLAEVNGKKTISGYSGKAVKPIALRNVLDMTRDRIMFQSDGKRHMEVSGIGGIETWRDALEFLQIGCRNVQVCTAVMQYGYRIIDDLMAGMKHYLAERGLESIEAIIGEEIPNFVLPADLDRETMVFPTIDREKCIGCGRCYISCSDGGHQAITFGPERKPHIEGNKCVGCHLCRLVCPTGAIVVAKRMQKRNK